MRIHRLEVEGFGPFRDRQVVDFDAFAHEGIFLIGGRTGAGKSSILDAICFALYGSVPRYEDGEKRLRSDHSALDEPTSVSLEFTSGDRRWRVERVPAYERLKKSGRGTTQSPAEARLWERVDGEWIGRAARPVDVAHELEPVLGLNLQQFLQVILLAQGRFARFLLARNDERQALLRTLFDSHRFGGYEAELERRRREASIKLEIESETLLVRIEAAEALAEIADPEGADIVERLAAVETARLRADSAVERTVAEESTAQRTHAAADAAHTLLVAQRRTQERRDRARAALAELLARSGEHAAGRELLSRARAAEELRAPLDAARRSTNELADAERAEAAAVARWTDAGEADATADELSSRADAVLGELATFRAALEREKELESLSRREADAAARAAGADLELTELDQRASALPALILERTAHAAEARTRADGVDGAAARTAEARGRVGAARESAELSAAHARAEAAAVAAGKALTRASAELDELRDRRFRDHAGELAELLVDGAPCSVCGSPAHPAPAERHDEPVTPEQLDAAERAKESAITADAEATTALRNAARALAEATARAAGLDIEAAEQALEAARAAEAVLVAAAARLAGLEQECAVLRAERDTLEGRRAEVGVRRAAAEAERVAVHQELRVAQRAVAAARGDAGSVRERIAGAEQTVLRARELAAARRMRVACVEAAADAAETLATLLEASPFATSDEARASLLDQTEREQLDAQLRAYDTEVASQRQSLMELELEALPEEPIDASDAERAAAAAQEAWRAAVARHADAQRLSAQLSDASRQAHDAHAQLGALGDQVRVIERLANTVAGRAPNTMKMNLETFVLAAELEEIVTAANLRLAEMSEGRYRLRHTDARAARGAASGLGIEVMDGHTGQARPVQSLSGGETFLASLALALGLAEVVTARAGGITLDTLFIDEGFGTLDPDTLDVAMRTLDELRQGGRTVGVISHVETMKDEVPARLLVEAAPQGPSVIRQDLSPV